MPHAKPLLNEASADGSAVIAAAVPRAASAQPSLRIVREGATAARWYAVQTLTHRENGAAFHLANQSFPVFLPCRRKTRRHAHRIDNVLVPFFPGYLFIQMDLTRDRWRSVNGTFGVARLVCHGDAPTPVPYGVVESLKATCDANGIMAWRPELRLGQEVRIAHGPFADLIGQIDRLDDAGRVRVLLDIMGGQIPICLPRESVVPAASCV